MGAIQKLMMKILPPKWAEAMEADSRRWMVRCDTCCSERSIWEIGGVRWKASGNSITVMRCPQCSKITRHTIYKKAE
jgi:hypothetical protein